MDFSTIKSPRQELQSVISQIEQENKYVTTLMTLNLIFINHWTSCLIFNVVEMSAASLCINNIPI